MTRSTKHTRSSFSLRVAAAVAVMSAAVAPASAAAQGARSAPDPLAILEEASQRYARASSLCADFRQVLTVPLLNQRREGSGLLCQAGSDRFAMRFSDPEGDAVVVDGEHVWVYYPSQDPRQVIRAPLSVSADGSGLDLHREFLHDPRQKYDATYQGTETVSGRTAHRILLKPRRDARYREAIVWIDTGDRTVSRIEIHDENGSVRTVHLSNIRFEPTIPEGTFVFTPPAGTQVITR